jgi:shikimate kinase
LNLLLVGVRGSGKSAAGAELARRLGCDFADLDEEVERVAGISVAEIFARSGEAEFRRLETEALTRMIGREHTVVATGGGAVVDATNRELMHGLGKVVWLRVSPETAVERVGRSSSRPALTDLPPLEEAREVARSRRAWYERVADEVVETDSLTLAEVCDELEQLWRALARDDVR